MGQIYFCSVPLGVFLVSQIGSVIVIIIEIGKFIVTFLNDMLKDIGNI
jgi:hypothetical protein